MKDVKKRKEHRSKSSYKSESGYRSIYKMVRLMCDNVPDMIWAKDLDKKYIFANKTICRDLLNAKDTDEPIGKTDMFFAQRERTSHPDNPVWHTFGEICGDSDLIVMAEKKPQRFDEFGNVKNRFLYLDVHKAPFFDGKGVMIGTVGAGRDVTQEKKIEHNLREKERQLHLIADSLPVLIAYIDKDQRYRYVNKTFENWFGITKEEMYGKHIKDVVGDDAYSVLREHVEKTLKGKRVTYEEKLVYKTGNTRFVSGILVPEAGVNSEVQGFYALVTDISERKEMEEALRASEERYRALFQNIPIGVGIATIDGNVVAYNEMMQKITGYSKHALEHINTKDFYYNKEEREKLAEILKKEGAVHNFETLLKRKNGSLFHASLNIVSCPIGDEDGMLTALQDISERKKTEKALMESEQRLSYIINFLPDATFAINTEGRIIVWNRAIEQMTGVSSVQVLGKGNYEHAVHFYGKRRPILADLVLKPDREIEKTYTFIAREMDCLIAEPLSPVTILGQTRYLWAKASPMYDADGNIIGAIESIRDITERKTIEETLKKSEQTVQTLLNANPETELLIDKEGTILAGNNTSQYQGESVSLAYLRDITDRKLSSDTLRDSEIKYRTLLDNVNDAIFLMLKDIFIDCNEKALFIFGCTREDIIGKTPWLFSPPTQPDGKNSQEKAMEIISIALSRKAQFFEWKHSKLDGTVFDAEVSLNSIELGGKTYIQVIVRDVTQRKQYDQSLKMSLAKLRKATGGIIDVIVMAVEMRDPYTAGHQKRVASLARSIAKEMGLTEESIDSIRMTGIIHDLGKISIPAEILTRPRKLTKTEYDLVKTHPQIGYDILKDIAFPWPIAQIVHQHHERLNGTGYPKGLKQADILLEARIIAVCDVVESMASHRPYRPALGIDIALEEIIKNKGILYDAEVVDSCVRLFIKKGFSFD